MKNSDLRSFWLPKIIDIIQPTSFIELIVLSIHSALLDIGFLSVQLLEEQNEGIVKQSMEASESTLSNLKLISHCDYQSSLPDSNSVRIPLTYLKDDGISLAIVPSGWRQQDAEQYNFQYIHPAWDENFKNNRDVVRLLKVKCFKSSENVLVTVDDVFNKDKCLTAGFKISQNEGYFNYHTCDQSLILKTIKENIIEKLLSESSLCSNSGNETSRSRNYNEVSLNSSNLYFQSSPCNLDSTVQPIDPLVDDRGVKGNLVGPNSQIFNNFPGTKFKPKFDPVSSIPGHSGQLNNDMFFPPGPSDMSQDFFFK
ncbi:hypothetical protein cand_025460 [Cryptosporidium andersoni]|uniref:PI31 proteasome regulator N-terminal domain-containing protein n=1 Tax=Cryptosporidium andersoni TaxID=117008 RepID=A0A1J4MA86_9CRYT|nr:hypothetical protein cand_025460 [Cryptosporidium andersoni]